jgi:hypothetical protein
MQIEIEAAVESLWQALDWEFASTIEPTKVFDRIAHHLRRNPRFRGMSITEIDLLLADARREFEHDVDELGWRLVRSFKDEIGFSVVDGAAA